MCLCACSERRAKFYSICIFITLGLCATRMNWGGGVMECVLRTYFDNGFRLKKKVFGNTNTYMVGLLPLLYGWEKKRKPKMKAKARYNLINVHSHPPLPFNELSHKCVQSIKKQQQIHSTVRVNYGCPFTKYSYYIIITWCIS